MVGDTTGPIVSALFGRDGEGPSSGSNDEGTAVQCQVTASNGGGIVIADNINPLRVAPVPTEQSELPGRPSFEPEEGPSPSLPNSAETIGPVSVSDHLPDGLVFAGEAGLQATGSGWECKVETPMNATCLRSDTLEPGGSYPPIVLRTRVQRFGRDRHATRAGASRTLSPSLAGARHRPVQARATLRLSLQPYPKVFRASRRASQKPSRDPFTQAGGHPIRGDRHVCVELHRLQTSLARLRPSGWRGQGHRDRTAARASSGIPKTCRPNVRLLSISRRLRLPARLRGSASFVRRGRRRHDRSRKATAVPECHQDPKFRLLA